MRILKLYRTNEQAQEEFERDKMDTSCRFWHRGDKRIENAQDVIIYRSIQNIESYIRGQHGIKVILDESVHPTEDESFWIMCAERE